MLKKIVSFILLLLIMTWVLVSSQASEDSFSNYDITEKPLAYIICPGDKLYIYVWQHPELSMEVIVRPDGKISFPIIDDIEVNGFTPEQLDNSITQRLNEFIKDPSVTIMVKDFSSRKICILGEVRNPGIYPLTGHLSIVEAIAMADYDKDSAVLDSVVVIRERYKGNPKAMRINLRKIIKGKVEENILLEPNDVIFVPKSFISKLDNFLEFFTRKIQPSIQTHFTRGF